MNIVTLVGNITRDPGLRFFDGDKSVANTSIAVNESFKGSDGEWKENTTFVDVSVWNNNGAENVASSLNKGDRVLVSGKLKQSQWEQDGVTRTKLEMVATEIGPTMKWAEVSVTKTSGGGSNKSKPSEIKHTYNTPEEKF